MPKKILEVTKGEQFIAIDPMSINGPKPQGKNIEAKKNAWSSVKGRQTKSGTNEELVNKLIEELSNQTKKEITITRK